MAQQVASTITQLDAWQLQQLAQSTVTAVPQNVVNVGNNGQFVFFAVFDGTNNNRANLPLSGDPQMTNAAQLEILVKNANQGNLNVATGYYPGPGTSGPLDMSSWLSPTTTADVISKAVTAYNEFADKASKWLDNNPTGSITAMVSSFSRGNASAAIFSQLLYERGLIVLVRDEN